MSPPAAAGSGGKAFKSDDLLKGGLLSCAEAATVGLPFEVWKTHMGTYRTETTSQAFKNIYQKGGVGAFWRGFQPKMVESFLKGAILMFAKDAIIRSSLSFGASETMAGLVGGFGGGVAQVTVLGIISCVPPYLHPLFISYITVHRAMHIFGNCSSYWGQVDWGFPAHFYDIQESGYCWFLPWRHSADAPSRLRNLVWGVSTFLLIFLPSFSFFLYLGTNWASRQGFTDGIRVLMKKHLHGDDKAKLSIAEEATAGIIGEMKRSNCLTSFFK